MMEKISSEFDSVDDGKCHQDNGLEGSLPFPTIDDNFKVEFDKIADEFEVLLFSSFYYYLEV